MSDIRDDRRAEAIKRLRDKRDFKNHVVIYVVVNAMLVIIWAASGADYFWPVWPIAGWGIAIVLHAWDIFGRQSITEDDIDQEIHRGTL